MRCKMIFLAIIVILLAVACDAPFLMEAPATDTPPEAATAVPEIARDIEISVVGSTTVRPLAEKLAEAWIAENPQVTIRVEGGGSSAGVKAAGDGTADIGNASRKVKDDELVTYPAINIYPIAADGIAIVVHPGVPVSGLTIDQVRDIFTGEVNDWQEVGGPAGPITVVSREEGSGTRGAFEELVTGSDVMITDQAIFQESNAKVRASVAETPNAIGYLSFGYLDDSVVALEINGVAATKDNILNETYPVVRPLNMLTNGEPEADVQAWLDWILGPAGQAIVEEEGYISVR